MSGVAQTVRAPGCDPGDYEFESRHPSLKGDNTMGKFISIALMLMLSGCVWTTVSEDQVILKPDYQGVVSIRTIGGAGSGFVIAQDKEHWYVATAAHVVGTMENLPVSAPMVNGVVGEVIAYGNADNENDIAILKVKKYNRRYRVYRLASVKQEARVRVIGYLYPNGLEAPVFSIYIGHIVNLNWNDFICYNGGVFPGMSGGPMLDQWGQVVGITSRCPSAWGCPLDSSSLFVKAEKLQEMLDGLGL